jgi:leucyl aminopeptidase
MYSLHYTDTFPKDKNCMIVFISFDEDYIHYILSNMGYDTNYVGIPVTMKNKNTVILYHIDPTTLYISMKDIAIKLKHMNTNICLSLTNIPYQYKLLILHFICKYSYTFDKYMADKHNKVIFVRDKKKNAKLIEHLIHQMMITNSNRDFQNEPANIINPATFCGYAKNFLKTTQGIKINIYNDHQLKNMGLKMISEMGKGSVFKPRLLELKYSCNRKNARTVCVIGKGVTFDSGGLDLKNSSSMDNMKLDKTGGCTVVSLLKYAADRKLGCNIIGLVPLIENSISAEALHPGDIIQSYNKKTVEIVNTDAEGRIILANAIEYSERFKPDYIIDLATLTGSAEIFHCDVSAVFYTLNPKIKQIVENIGENVGERVVAMPTWPEYKEYTKGEVANVKNFGFSDCKRAGTYMAAMFLLNFVPEKLKNRWIHFDVTNIVTDKVVNGNSTLLMINLLDYISYSNE